MKRKRLYWWSVTVELPDGSRLAYLLLACDKQHAVAVVKALTASEYEAVSQDGPKSCRVLNAQQMAEQDGPAKVLVYREEVADLHRFRLTGGGL